MGGPVNYLSCAFLVLLSNMGCPCRYDWLAKKNLRAGYFLWAMIAYGLGKNYNIEEAPCYQFLARKDIKIFSSFMLTNDNQIEGEYMLCAWSTSTWYSWAINMPNKLHHMGMPATCMDATYVEFHYGLGVLSSGTPKTTDGLDKKRSFCFMLELSNIGRPINGLG